jgi:hypothetical protein
MRETGRGIQRPETAEERNWVVADKIANDPKKGYNTQSEPLVACRIPHVDKKKPIIYLVDIDERDSEKESRRIRERRIALAWECLWESLALRDKAK